VRARLILRTQHCEIECSTRSDANNLVRAVESFFGRLDWPFSGRAFPPCSPYRLSFALWPLRIYEGTRRKAVSHVRLEPLAIRIEFEHLVVLVVGLASEYVACLPSFRHILERLRY